MFYYHIYILAQSKRHARGALFVLYTIDSLTLALYSKDGPRNIPGKVVKVDFRGLLQGMNPESIKVDGDFRCNPGQNAT